MAQKRKKRSPQRIPKGAKGLSVKRGGCRTVKGAVMVCVAKNGTITIRRATRPTWAKKRKAAGPKKKPRKAAAKRTVRGKAKCVTTPFKMKTKKGVRCACGTRTKSGGMRPTYLPMDDARCKRSVPGPMAWSTFASRQGVVRTTPIVNVKGLGRRKPRRRRRRR